MKQIGVYRVFCSINRFPGEVCPNKEKSDRYLSYVNNKLYCFVCPIFGDVTTFAAKIPVGSINTLEGSFDEPIFLGSPLIDEPAVIVDDNRMKNWEKADILRPFLKELRFLATTHSRLYSLMQKPF